MTVSKKAYYENIFINILLFVVLSFLFILSNYITFTGSSWFLHPDERDVYSIAKSFYTTGNLYIYEPRNVVFPDKVFTPDGSTSIDDRILPGRSIGLFMLVAPFFIFGTDAPFFVISICGVILVLFVYLIARKLFDSKTALITLLLFAFSPNVIYWSNMFFSNIPALMFFVVALYLYLINKSKITLPLIGLFIALAIWMRYEYVILVCIFFVSCIVVYRSKSELLKLSIIGVSVMLFLSPILMVNKTLYGNYFSFGYTQNAYDVKTQQTIDYSISSDDSLMALPQKYLKRFTGQFSDPNIPFNFKTNFNEYVYNLIPIATILGTLGLVLVFNKVRRSPVLLCLLICSVFLLVYFGFSSALNGFNKSWLGGSYSRYFLIPILLLCITAAAFISKLQNMRVKFYLIIMIFAFSIVNSINIAFNSPLSLRATVFEKSNSKKINNMVQSLPENAVIISNFYSKAIIDRPVLIPRLIQARGEKLNKTVIEYTLKLLPSNRVYVLDNSNHASYIDLHSTYKNDPRFKVNEIEDDLVFYEVALK